MCGCVCGGVGGGGGVRACVRFSRIFTDRVEWSILNLFTITIAM